MRPLISNPAPLLLLAAFSGVLGVCTDTAWAQAFHLVTPLANGLNDGRVTGLSADGTKAAGNSSRAGSPFDIYTSFRWTDGQGAVDIGLDSGRQTDAYAISADGHTVVGSSFVYNRQTGYNMYTAGRWTGPGTYQVLAPRPLDTESIATGVSADGSITVGYSGINFGLSAQAVACYWDSQGNITSLGFIPGEITEANNVSGNGSVIVGVSYGSPTDHAFSWTQTTGYVGLPTLTTQPYVAHTDRAYAASFDGSIIVGSSNGRGVMWNNGVVSELLAQSGWFAYDAAGVSADGSVIIGTIANPTSGALIPGVWTAATGFVPLTDYLTQHGVTLPAGASFPDVRAVSADGRTFGGEVLIHTGTVIQDFGFVATIPSPSGISMGLAVFTCISLRRRRSIH